MRSLVLAHSSHSSQIDNLERIGPSYWVLHDPIYEYPGRVSLEDSTQPRCWYGVRAQVSIVCRLHKVVSGSDSELDL